MNLLTSATCAALTCLFSAPLSSSAEPLPLSTSYWKDPGFLKSFNGAYRIEARIEPNLSTEERGLLVEVQKLMATGKRKAAAKTLTNSPLTKKSPALTYNLGNIEFELGNLETATKHYQAALKAFPSFRRAHKNLALAHLRAEELPKALPHLIEAIRLGDSEGNTYGLLGYCHLARGEYGSALQAYQMARMTEPDTVQWTAGIAQCLDQMDAKPEAAALLEEVIRKAPSESSFAVLRANILLDLELSEEACKTLELPFRLGILPPSETLLLAQLHLRENRLERTRSAIANAFENPEKPPAAPAIHNLLETAVFQKEWNLFEEIYAKTPKPAPSKISTLQGIYLIASDSDPTAGQEILETEIKNNPRNGPALLALATQLAKTGENSRAELLFERAQVDPTVAFQALTRHAELAVSQQRYDLAIKKLGEAYKLNPSDGLATYQAAVTNLASAAQ